MATLNDPVDAALDERGCPTTGAPPADQDDQIDPTPFVRRTEDGASELELLVRGAHCAGCIRKIEGGDPHGNAGPGGLASPRPACAARS